MNSTVDNNVKIIVVDDEPAAIRSLKLPLKSAGFQKIQSFSSGISMLETIQATEQCILLLDLFMPDCDGENILREVKKKSPQTEVIIITGDNRLDRAVSLMQQGASDYLVKPVEEQRLVSSVQRSAELLELRRANISLKQRLINNSLENPEAFKKILTRNREMKAIFSYLEVIAGTSQPILITGETGVGKELIAEAIHELSKRNGELVKLNVAGLDDTMFSDTLFGHFKGAFTGAISKRAGLLERANDGTLVLDEMGSLPARNQVKLLRLLQDGEYYPLGADMPRLTNARIIAITNRSIDQLQTDPDFRDDLYFRLRTHHLHIIPLRDRKEDIPLLLRHFIEEAARELQIPAPSPHPGLVSLLGSYYFPGNIRELRAMVFEAVSKHTGQMLDTNVFSNYIPGAPSTKNLFVNTAQIKNDLSEWMELPGLKEMEELLIVETLQRCANNQSLAARLLGITPSALNKRLNKKQV